MKPLTRFPYDPRDFSAHAVVDLVTIWLEGHPVAMHQCAGVGLSCGPSRVPTYHDADVCLYVQVDWHRADAIARQILQTPPVRDGDSLGLLDPDKVLAEAKSLAGNNLQLGTAATSLLTDPIALHNDVNIFGGRHRIAAVADQGLETVLALPAVYKRRFQV